MIKIDKTSLRVTTNEEVFKIIQTHEILSESNIWNWREQSKIYYYVQNKIWIYNLHQFN